MAAPGSEERFKPGSPCLRRQEKRIAPSELVEEGDGHARVVDHHVAAMSLDH